MWTPGRTAAVPVLVVGLALLGAPADARAEAAPAAAERVAAAVAVAAAERVAAAVAVAADDERQGLAGQAALADAATHTLEQNRAEAAARAEAERVAAEQAAREAAAARAAAEAAAAQAAADQAAAARAAAAKATAKAVTKPARPPAGAGAPAEAGIVWRTTVVDSGGQDAVDRCLGGLTHWYENVDGKPYYTVHRSCGGTPILGLRPGDRVRIDGATWVVTDLRDVPVGSRYHTVAGMNGQILLQTCHLDDVTLRVVALTAA